MKVFSIRDYGKVRAVELGGSPFGKPLMTTRVFLLDNILIDSGLKHCRKEVIELIRENPVSAVYLTHFHEDHSGNAAALQSQLNLPVLGHPITVEKMKSPRLVFPYQRVMWGAASSLDMMPLQGNIETDHFLLQPIHTPGHSRDHLSFFEAEQGWFFSGDLYLGDRIKYFRADEVFKDQVSSLEKALELDFEALFCTHNPKPVKGKEHLRRKLDFFQNLSGGVGELMKKGFPAKVIMKELKVKEPLLVKLMCFGNVSAENMILSIMESLS